MAKNKISVGDIVKIKGYGWYISQIKDTDSEDIIVNGIPFTKEMSIYCSDYLIVSRIDGTEFKCQDSQGQDLPYIFSDWMVDHKFNSFNLLRSNEIIRDYMFYNIVIIITFLLHLSIAIFIYQLDYLFEAFLFLALGVIIAIACLIRITIKFHRYVNQKM